MIGRPLCARVLVGVAVASIAIRARAQSYGESLQTLVIGAAEFASNSESGDQLGPDGYLSEGASPAFAEVSLPDGVSVQAVCLDAHNLAEGALSYAFIEEVKLAPGGSLPARVIIESSLVETEAPGIGYQSTCTNPFDYQFHSSIDLNGDGIPDHVTHLLIVATGPDAAIGAVRIAWKRQVSAGPATPTFGDVPQSDAAWTFIEALAASGITAGCGGGDYCPDATLTRRQMAVFLAKALGLNWGS